MCPGGAGAKDDTAIDVPHLVKTIQRWRLPSPVNAESEVDICLFAYIGFHSEMYTKKARGNMSAIWSSQVR